MCPKEGQAALVAGRLECMTIAVKGQPLMGSSALVSSRIADSIGQAIVHGVHPVGSILPSELELCARFGVSRTGIREALKMLGAKGLIAPRRRVGGIVTDRSSWSLLDPDVLRWMRGAPADIDLLTDLANLRLAIEPEAARLAARLADQDLIRAIGAAGEAMAADPERALIADVQFHVALLRASGNRFFSALAPMVESALAMSIPVTNEVKRVPKADVDLHLAIYSAIRDGNGERAAQLSHDLIAETLRLLAVADT